MLGRARPGLRAGAAGGTGRAHHPAAGLETVADRTAGAMAAKSRRVGARGGGRVDRQSAPTVDSTGQGGAEFERRTWRPDCVVDCGWGRLVFAHTFSGPRDRKSTRLKSSH